MFLPLILIRFTVVVDTFSIYVSEYMRMTIIERARVFGKSIAHFLCIPP